MGVIEALNLPKANLKLIRQQQEVKVWCVLRKKYLLLTPEEWVRQHLIHFFINELQFPIERLVSEYSFEVDGLSRRCDLLVLNSDTHAHVVVECKAKSVHIDEAVFRQIAQYNKKLQANFLMLSNGMTHILAKVDKLSGELIFIDEINKEAFH